MIRIVSGNIFDYEADIRVNTVNCVGIMGAGVALQFKKKYPEMFKDYLKACDKKELQPGKPHLWYQENLLNPVTIINLPTKIHWKNPSEYEYIEKGLDWLRHYLNTKSNITITLPALGCGHGGLDWDIVKKMIYNFLEDLNITILLFEPLSSTFNKFSEELDNKLKSNHISRLLPSDDNYPSKLKGRSSLEIFYQGNIGLLKKKNIAIIVTSKPEEREKKALFNLIDELPISEFVFLLGYSNSYEIDITKEVLSRGFQTLIVIPFGILNLKIRKDLKDYWIYDNIGILSITNPDQIWKSYEISKSLDFRLRMANITLINSLYLDPIIRIEKELNKPNKNIFYFNYWKHNIDFFNKLSAKKVGINPNTMKPNISPIISTLKEII